jgi:predicted transcriptional regulator
MRHLYKRLQILLINVQADLEKEVNQLSRQASLAPRLRQRLDMVRLSDLGLTIGEIAQNLQVHHQTVRKYLHAFETAKPYRLFLFQLNRESSQLSRQRLVMKNATLDDLDSEK